MPPKAAHRPKSVFATPLLAALLLALGLVAAHPAFGAPQETPDVDPEARRAALDKSGFEFAMAKVLAEEGSYREALEGFERAVTMEPEEAYIRAEYAEFLVRLARLSRSPRYRREQLARAEQQAAAARRLAEGDLDVLRVTAETYLALAELDTRSGTALANAREIFEEIRAARPEEVNARLSLAQIYSYQGKNPEAIKVYREVLDTAPGDRRTYALLVDALLQEDREDDALTALKEQLASDPGADDTRLRMAQILAQQGRHDEAVKALQGGSEDFLGGFEVRRFLGFQLFLAGDLEAALGHVDDVYQRQPDVAVGRLRAVILRSLDRPEESRAQLEELHADFPESEEVALTLAQVLLEDGDAERGQEVLGATLAQLEDEGEREGADQLRLQWIEALLAAEEWSRALAVSEPLVLKRGDRAEPLVLFAALLRAEALTRLDRADEALALLEGQQPEEPGNLAKRAEILIEMGRQEEAQSLLQRLASEGSEASAVAAAMVFQQQELWQPAAEILRTYLETHPESIRALFTLGAVNERSGRRSEAVEAFQRLLELDPSFHQAQNYLGYMWAERGENLDEALALIEQAVEQEPDNGAYVDSLGWVHFQLGNHAEAVRHLERAAQLVPNDPTVLEHLGDALIRVGRSGEALEAYREARDLEPEDPEALGAKIRNLESAAGS